MRIDFNQRGSWRKGIDLPESGLAYVVTQLERVADMANIALRLVNDAGEVVRYRDPNGVWRDANARARR